MLHQSPLLVGPWQSPLNWLDLGRLLTIICCMSMRMWY
jgi:hypothetical protein